MGHQDPFWLTDIVVGIKKVKMWGDGSDDETGTFCPIEMCTSDGYHGVGWGLQKAYGVPKGRCGTIKANEAPLRRMLAPKGKWGAKKAYGAP
jgi:hypothetical protein